MAFARWTIIRPRSIAFAAMIALFLSTILSSAQAQEEQTPSTATKLSESLVSSSDRNFWSFQPLKACTIPSIRQTSLTRNTTDTFLLARLESHDLTFSISTDPETLIRRLFLDLIGVPPSLPEIDEYLTDASADATERLVDRLLSSPRFGERWGRHWLDVAGYVDTVGFDTDATNIITSEGKWRYRDFVIDAFNRDIPYDRFITMQLAGDEMYDWRQAKTYSAEILDSLIATGFLRTARDMTHEDVGVIPQNFHGLVHDTLEIVGTGLLGLTLNCARCHSHKFDPIPQEDYYQLMATLTPAYNPTTWLPVIPYEPKIRDRALPDVSPFEQSEIEEHNRAVETRLNTIRQLLNKLRKPYETRLFEEHLLKIPDVIRSDTREAVNTPADKRSEVQKYLATKFGPMLNVKADEVTATLSPEDRKAVSEFEAQITKITKEKKSWGKIQALYDVGPLPKTHLFLRGDENSPGAEVSPGYLRVLCVSDDESQPTITPRHDGSSGRRTELANWLTKPNSPSSALLARVMVNRVWQHVFGRGLVTTPDNFGAQGLPPTHPELFEYLCREFVGNGWQIKPLLRRLATSTAYQQTSRRDVSRDTALADPAKIDPGNELLWRMPLRRLESETVRDCILATSGRLSCSSGGPPVLTEAKSDGSVVINLKKLTRPDDQWRRSIYLLSRRAYNLSLLTVFDQPQIATNCLGRDSSAVPLQSLTMLNDEFLLEQSTEFASRIETTVGSDLDSNIITAFRLATGRRPNPNETVWCRDLIEQQTSRFRDPGVEPATASHQALTQLCHALLNTSEFLYVE